MTAALVFGTYDGRATVWIEKFPVTVPMDRPVVEINSRYELTMEQATMPINQLKAMVAAGIIRNREGGSAESRRLAGSD